MPPWWGRVLAPALEAGGARVVNANSGVSVQPGILAAAVLDLRKAIGCVEDAALRRELAAVVANLGNPLARVIGIYTTAHHAVAALSSAERKHALLVTTCTYDPPGRALAAVARETGLPLVHLAHACQSGPPEGAWYAGEVPGDWLLVPGERDAAWWEASCLAHATAPQIVVTGQPLWDGYARLVRQPVTPPQLVWLAESGAHPTMQPGTWTSRDVPQRAWQAFLAALASLPADLEWQLCLKTRSGEDPALVERWMADLFDWEFGHVVTHTDAWLQEVLPGAAVVVGQDSNGLLEAAHLGIPCLSITRRGGALFAPEDPVLVLDGEGDPDELAQLLAPPLGALLRRPPADGREAAALRAMARRYNAGADGRGLVRTVATLQGIAAAGTVRHTTEQEVA